MKKLLNLGLLLLYTAAGCQSIENKVQPQSTQVVKKWTELLQQELPTLGHRNWILIVDKAYPAPSTSDIEVINTGKQFSEVVGEVFGMLDSLPHIKPVVYQDIELENIDEQLVVGIGAFKNDLAKQLGNRELKRIRHDDIFQKMDEASKLFRIVVLKTEGLIPYSSLFLELDCKYWSAQKERILRTKMLKTEK